MGLSLRRGLSGPPRRGRPRPAARQCRDAVAASRRDQQASHAGAYAVLVLDGAGYHIADDLVIPDNLSLLILPPYSPELNPIENVWQYLRQNKLAITVFEDYAHIVDKCCQAWNFFANDKAVVASITSRQWAAVNA